MVQVQVRISDELAEKLDRWISAGRFRSRSDAVRTILGRFEEWEKTRDFYSTLVRRSREIRENPEMLVPLEDLE